MCLYNPSIQSMKMEHCMCNFGFKWLIIFTCLPMYLVNGILKEYCVEELFNPTCGDGKLILMNSALYGRMKLGKCIPTDFGYLGCKADVLNVFDGKCSGERSCDVPVTNSAIQPQGGCIKGLESYLEVEYSCVEALNIRSDCKQMQQFVIEATKPEFYLAEAQVGKCVSSNKGAITIQAKEGQLMNVSLINLQHGAGANSIYATLKDTGSSKNVLIGDGPRHKHLVLSSSHELELTLTELDEAAENQFMLHIKVSGCPNMPPPEGAWMTRNGDQMEIGCHSGAKVWSLTCQENQWVGAIGQCGSNSGPNQNQDVDSSDGSIEQTASLSINVMLFGISSLIILVSALIFMTGVCILRRKLRLVPHTTLQNKTLMAPYLDDSGTIFKTLPGQIPNQVIYGQAQGYKSLRPICEDKGTFVAKSKGKQDTGNGGPPAYMNTQGSDASDSVKYYVLEDAAKFE